MRIQPTLPDVPEGTVRIYAYTGPMDPQPFRPAMHKRASRTRVRALRSGLPCKPGFPTPGSGSSIPAANRASHTGVRVLRSGLPCKPGVAHRGPGPGPFFQPFWPLPYKNPFFFLSFNTEIFLGVGNRLTRLWTFYIKLQHA